MEIQTTKLGARVLSESELEAVLPNSESVFEQIEVFRSSIPGENDKQGDTEQKTNNIGIMGRRGAGKTSILRTFHEKLRENNTDNRKEKENAKGGDIILPIIIPENMSSGTTLMDVVLGILKPVVEEKEKERKKKNEESRGVDCIYSGRGPLEKAYNDLVKQYCYIKKDYRDILIQQFTTEQNYVDKTKEVFNSDTEFIKLFNEFVKLLLTGGEEDGTKNMMFLFIDDIDLSTTRCMDVVRTLLSYLSNPRIVTFISGDMETFEEALTLEFLRQEKALNVGVFHRIYYSTTERKDGKLLERKKRLAYEYLKKIIPPAYRRSIKYWSLEERGQYLIGDNGQRNLADLLIEVTQGRLPEAYFIYKEDGEEQAKYMSLSFHMFDDTSRGLNNVYNVLQELCFLKSKEKDGGLGADEGVLLWRLIETIVDAKPLYAKLKKQLLEQVIVREKKQVKVDFYNAYQLLYGDGKEENLVPKERFAIFLLVDFAAGLFSQDQRDGFAELKYRIIQEYLSDEAIDDKIATQRELIEWTEKETSKTVLQSILISFLEDGDFIFILYLVKYLGREEIYNIFAKEAKYRETDREPAYKVAYALQRAVWAMQGTETGIKEYLANLYIKMQDAMLKLLNMLSLNPWVIYGAKLTEDVAVEPGGLMYIRDTGNMAAANYDNVETYILESTPLQPYLLWAEYKNETSLYWVYFERNLREKTKARIPEISFDIKLMAGNLVQAGLTKTIMNQMQGTIGKYKVNELRNANYGNLGDESVEGEKPGEQNKRKKEQRERQVIAQIDEKEMWKTVYAKEKIYPYLRNKKVNYILGLTSGRVIFDATELLAGAYSGLLNCEKGSSGTSLVHGLVDQMKKIVALSEEDRPSKEEISYLETMYIDGKYYMRLEQVLVIQCMLEQFLKNHPRVRYGKMESRRLLMEMRELPLVIRTPEWNKIHEKLKKREADFFIKGKDNVKGEITKSLGDKLDGVVESICNEYLKPQMEKPLILVIKNYLENYLKEYSLDIATIDDNEYYYIWYLVHQWIIKEELKLPHEDWEKMEPIIPRANYMFIFHSYLRYLQANDPDIEKAGAQAQKIAELAECLLESEVIADNRIQSEVYEVISKELALTEEEFESLF